ncbi:MAG: hypothetical protein FIB08_07635 [Candidatus Methanoperedens sp.]|nr:hypothetical protein [Candidatus Methanoperedens sp.]
MVTVDQIDVRKLYYAAKARYGLQGPDDNAMLDRLCSIDGGAPCQAAKKMAGFSYSNVEVNPIWYSALGISTTQPPATPPAAACPEGTTRQVMCPKSNKMITQKCVSGQWVTQDAKGCITDEETNLGLLLALIVLIAVFLFLVRK